MAWSSTAGVKEGQGRTYTAGVDRASAKMGQTSRTEISSQPLSFMSSVCFPIYKMGLISHLPHRDHVRGNERTF